MATVDQVANYLLYLRNKDSETGKYHSLSNLKMQKLLYFCQGMYAVANNGNSLIDVEFEAWRYGPVVPSAYFRFNSYGQNDIPPIEAQSFSELNQTQKDIIRDVWEALKYRSAFDLVEASHVPDGPWHLAYHNMGPNSLIKQEDIYNYFGG